MIRWNNYKNVQMNQINQNQQFILSVLLQKDELQSSEIHKHILKSDIKISLVTVKRELTEIKSQKLINQSGAGRYIKYSISTIGRLLSNV